LALYYRTINLASNPIETGHSRVEKAGGGLIRSSSPSQTMKAKAFILFGALLLIFSQCFGDDASDVTRAFGGAANIAIIANADSANAWRTIGSLKVARHQGFGISDLYAKADKPAPVSKDQAAQLAKLLQDRHTYIQPGISLKGSVPMPEAVVAFTSGNKETDVYFCFQSNIMVVGQAQSDFDPGRAAILKIVKKIFPNDPQIQSFK
jgi:hypothetical protein